MPDLLKRIAESSRFQNAVLALIIFAAVLVGLETVPEIVSRYGALIDMLNSVVLWVFVVEALIKMGQHGRNFLRYFKDPWNVFDFGVIAICFLPINAQYAAVMRLARVFRSLRLVTAVPKLQLLVNALLISIPSMIYVGLLLSLLFYLYGVMGVFLFRPNDPVHFINLPTSMLTLFRVVTQEDWTDVMYIQMYGSDVYPYTNTTGVEPIPSARPILGAFFFCSFVFFGTMIMLNLFIGVILNSMDEVQRASESAAETAGEGVADGSGRETLGPLGERLDAIDAQLRQIRDQLNSR
jgi:voltage-gated sodium channel